MKLLMLIYSGPSPQHIAALLERHRAPGYTEIDDVRGAGTSGRMMGDRVWPGMGTVFASAVPDDRVADLRDALLDYRSSAGEGEHLHVAVLPVEEFF